MDELIVATRTVHFAALALLFGAPLFRLAIARDGPARDLPGGRGIELAAALAVLVSELGWFAGVAATFAGGWSDALAPDVLGAVTTTSPELHLAPNWSFTAKLDGEFASGFQTGSIRYTW